MRGYVVRFEPFEGTALTDAKAAPEAAAAAMNEGMERLIRRLPTQYLWGYARYKQPRRRGFRMSVSADAGHRLHARAGARAAAPGARFWAVLGHLLHTLARPRRHVVDTNLALCFPDMPPEERRRIARETFVHVAQAFLDRGWLWHARRAVVERRIRLHGALHEFEGDTPTIVFAPHFFGLDAGGTALSIAVPRPWTSIFTPQRDPMLDDWLRSRPHAFPCGGAGVRPHGRRQADRERRCARAACCTCCPT